MAAVMSRAMQQFENNLKIRGSAWKFGMGFLGGELLALGFCGGLWEAPCLGIFLPLCSLTFDRPRHLKPGVPPPPPPLGCERVNWTTNC